MLVEVKFTERLPGCVYVYVCESLDVRQAGFVRCSFWGAQGVSRSNTHTHTKQDNKKSVKGNQRAIRGEEGGSHTVQGRGGSWRTKHEMHARVTPQHRQHILEEAKQRAPSPARIPTPRRHRRSENARRLCQSPACIFFCDLSPALLRACNSKCSHAFHAADSAS